MAEYYNTKFKNLMAGNTSLNPTEEEGGLKMKMEKAISAKTLNKNIVLAKTGADLLGLNDGSTEGGAASGALSGAATGAQFGGAPGAIVGGVVGGLAGGLGASAKQKAAHKAAKARAAAQHHQNLGRIEQEKDQKIQNALESMKAAFSRNLGRTRGVKL